MTTKVSVAELNCRSYVEYTYGHRIKSAEAWPIRRRSIRDLEIPNDAVCFSFYDQVEVKVNIGSETETLTVKRKPSETFYYGDLYTAGRIRRELPGQRHLLRLMRQQGSNHAVRSLFGHWLILDRDVRVVSPRSRHITKVR